MAQERAPASKVLQVVPRFLTILAVTAMLALLIPGAVGQSTATLPLSKFAYVVGNNIVSGYMIDSATGALTEIGGSPFATGAWARSVAADPLGHFLYVANANSDDVSAYAIDSTSGYLTEIAGSPFASGWGPVAVTLDPTGRFLYVGNEYGNDISAYLVDPATGALAQVVGSPSGLPNPVGLAVVPSGKFLYVADFGGFVSGYAIDAASGKLSEITGSPFYAGSGAFQVAITPSGEFVYVAVQALNAVVAYSIDNGGVLTQIPGSPFSAGEGPYYVAVDPSGRFVYTANFFSHDVSGYTIAPATGALTQIAGSPFPAGQYPGGITTDLSGKFVYAANWGSGSTSGFTIEPSTGALSPIPGSPFLAETGVISVTTVGSSGPQNSTSTTLASSLTSSVYGQAVTFTVHVTSDAGTPAGAVQIRNGSTVVGGGTLVSGTVSIPVSTLAAGTDLITASYLGGVGFAGSKSDPITQVVTPATTTTALASSLNPAATGQPVILTATVNSQYGAGTTGSVTFSAGAQNLGTVPLSGKLATLTTTFSAAGSYSISAQYSGDPNNFASTSSSLTQVVRAATTTLLTSSLNPALAGQTITFTATVTSSSGLPPNGETVTFKNGSNILGTVALSAGKASLTTSSLPAGVFTISASYPGDSGFASSNSSGLRQVVNSTTKSATTITLSSSLNPSIYGHSITWTARVTTAGPVPPTGTVTFTWRKYVQTYTIGSATLNSSGVATFTRSNLNADPYPMAAIYKGDTNNLASTSAILNQVVQPTTSSATIAAAPNPSVPGQAVTFSAKVTSPTVIPGGPVTFTAGTTVLATVQLAAGKATLVTASLPIGSSKVTVTYLGSSNISKSSAVVVQTIAP